MRKASYDAIVLGSGVIGCSTAFNLALLGARVAVIEKGSQVAAGATSRSSGCLRTHYSVDVNADHASRAVNYFRNFQDELQNVDADAGYVAAGHMLVGGGNELGEQMEATVLSLQGRGYNTRMISKDEARHLHPQLRLDDEVQHVGWEPDSGFADPYLTTNSFKQAAQQLGVEFHFGCEATGLLMRDSDVMGVQTDQGNFEAPVTVSCMNIWTPSTIGKWLDVELPMKLEKHVLIAVRKSRDQLGYRHEDGGVLPNVKCLVQAASQPYFRAYDGGRSLLVGNNNPNHADTVTDDCADDRDWDESVCMDHQIHCAALAAGRFEGYEDAEIVTSWSGIYDVAEDWNPVLGGLDGIGGLVAAFGFSGHGFKLSPIVGQMLAHEALGVAAAGDGDSPDISPYNIRRFDTGCELRGVYHGAAS